MHDPWEPSFLQPTASPLSRKNSLDNLCMLSSSKTRKSTSLRRGKSPKRRNFLMDREQEDCQSSVALLDSFESTLETSASQCSTSMQTIFSALQTELTQSNITSRLKQLPPSTCCSNKKVSVNSVKDISALLGDAKDLRFFEEMTDLLEGLQDTSLCLIS